MSLRQETILPEGTLPPQHLKARFFVRTRHMTALKLSLMEIFVDLKATGEERRERRGYEFPFLPDQFVRQEITQEPEWGSA